MYTKFQQILPDQKNKSITFSVFMGDLASLALAGKNEETISNRRVQKITQGQKAEVVFTTDSINGYYS